MIKIADKHHNGGCKICRRLLLQKWVLCQGGRHLEIRNKCTGGVDIDKFELPLTRKRHGAICLHWQTWGLPRRESRHVEGIMRKFFDCLYIDRPNNSAKTIDLWIWI